MEVEQPGKVIKIHLDSYIETLAVLNDYKEFTLLPNFRVPRSPGVVLNHHHEDCPTLLDPRKQKHCQSFVANLQFAASWIRYDISFTDSDWGNSSSRRPTSGSLCLYNRPLILWRSTMRKTAALGGRLRQSTTRLRATAATQARRLGSLLERTWVGHHPEEGCSSSARALPHSARLPSRCMGTRAASPSFGQSRWRRALAA
jgi:hypothetical protein